MSPNPQGSPPARRPRPLQKMSPGVKLTCPRTTYRMKYENRTTRLQTTHRYPTRDGTRLHCTNGSNTKKAAVICSGLFIGRLSSLSFQTMDCLDVAGCSSSAL